MGFVGTYSVPMYVHRYPVRKHSVTVSLPLVVYCHCTRFAGVGYSNNVRPGSGLSCARHSYFVSKLSQDPEETPGHPGAIASFLGLRICLVIDELPDGLCKRCQGGQAAVETARRPL